MSNHPSADLFVVQRVYEHIAGFSHAVALLVIALEESRGGSLGRVRNALGACPNARRPT